MNSELNFEIAPFEWTAGVRGEREIQAFDAELGDLETGEEFERGGRLFARGSAPASRRIAAPSRSKPAARGPVRAGGARMRPPMRPPSRNRARALRAPVPGALLAYWCAIHTVPLANLSRSIRRVQLPVLKLFAGHKTA